LSSITTKKSENNNNERLVSKRYPIRTTMDITYQIVKRPAGEKNEDLKKNEGGRE